MNDSLAAMLRAVTFIEDHLPAPLSVAQAADAAGYSLYHFIRTFNRCVQHTPYDYIMRRRLSQSALALLSSRRRVIDIALDFGFESPESYARAFKRLFGSQPSQWRRQWRGQSAPVMPALTAADLEYRNSAQFTFPQATERPAQTYHGLMSALSADESARRAQCRQLFSDLSAAIRAPLPQPGVAITVKPAGARGGAYCFAALPALRTESALAQITIPAGMFVRLSIQAENRDCALTYLAYTWQPLTRQTLRLDGQIETGEFNGAEWVPHTMWVGVSAG